MSLRIALAAVMLFENGYALLFCNIIPGEGRERTFFFHQKAHIEVAQVNTHLKKIILRLFSFLLTY